MESKVRLKNIAGSFFSGHVKGEVLPYFCGDAGESNAALSVWICFVLFAYLLQLLSTRRLAGSLLLVGGYSNAEFYAALFGFICSPFAPALRSRILPGQLAG